jgi:hypothetical protein
MIHLNPTGAPVNEVLVAEWTGWAQSFSPRVFGTLNTQTPLTFEQHVRAHSYVARLYQERCGELPTTVLAVQRNPSRPGYHSHSLICGRERVLEVRRTDVWASVRSHVGGWCLCGRGGSLCVGEARLGVANVRPRFEPVRAVTDVTAYCVRYCMREDVESMVTVLPGDELTQKKGPALAGPLSEYVA